MISIPSLTLEQLELLRLAKEHSVEELELAYESPVNSAVEPPVGHPAFIQGLLNAGLILVKNKGTFLRASEYQQESWAKFCEDIDHPTQGDWDQWRKVFISSNKEEIDFLMHPGKSFKKFSNVWIRKIGVKVVQPRN
ncbi:hypothetical protein [Acaryochloris marina]|uniref:hypothetical protein n=1 Tax=Acaryochloris marina TaxID=155978 RepID=UPI001BAF74D0|nr:hypothetical protein [Acaryochloris marina]QUY44808.1 hypothetical protein I1H34_12405 [Acaryochloris marina S15]